MPPVDSAHWPISRCSAPHDRKCSPVLGPTDAAATGTAAAAAAATATAAAATDPTKAVTASTGSRALVLRRGATNEDVLRLLDAPAVRDAALVTLDSAEGAFSGWSSNHEQAMLFNALESYFLLGGDWCCSSRDRNEGRLYAVDPPKLTMPRKRA
jgi:hypothetical protein